MHDKDVRAIKSTEPGSLIIKDSIPVLDCLHS